MKKVEVKGAIVSNDDKGVYDYFGINATCPKDIDNALEDAKGAEVEVHINSGGGNIFAGSEIYTTLRNYEGEATILIVGIAASAASVIAMARKSKITPTGQFMIHNVSSQASGDYKDMEQMAEALKSCNISIANAYKEKTGLSEDELLALMEQETYMSAEIAVEKGFVDEVMFKGATNRITNSISEATNLIPIQIIEKMRNELHKPPSSDKDDAAFLMQQAQAKYNFLNLKGVIKDD